MRKDFKRYSLHINRHYTSNWSIGIDYYKVFAMPEARHQATVFQIGLLFGNITFTRWQDKLWT
jgi:hypothetical protein